MLLFNRFTFFFVFFLFYLFFILIPTTEALNVSIASGYFNKIIQFPQISVIDSTNITFSCPAHGVFSDLSVSPTFFSQAGTFVPIVGFLITVSVYGTKSVFGYMTTCLLDDIVILTSTLALIFSWYTFSKPLWLSAVVFSIQNREFPHGYSFAFSATLMILFVSLFIILLLLGTARFFFHIRRNK